MTPPRLIAAAALVAALVYAPLDLRHVWRDVRNAHAQSRTERLLTPARSVGIEHPDAVERAAAVIPRNATYAVVTGPGAQAPTWVPFWAAYTLLPRRGTNPQDAQWILGYGADTTPVPIGRRVELGDGVWVAKVVR